MISVFLLPLFLAGTPATIGGAPSGDPPIRLWINNDGRYLPGDHAKVQVRTEYDGYLIVLHVDPDGYLRVLFPLDPDKDNFVRGGKKYEVRGRGGREAFEAGGKGRGTVYAAVTHEPLRFDGFVTGDHWDYRALAPSRLPENPETELNDLVRRMAQGNFDYDLLSYEVIESVVYASDYSYFPGNFAFSADFFFGRPFRRFDPFFDPFFFDPFFFRPFFFDPFLHGAFFFDPFFDPFLRQRFFFDPFFDPFVRPGLFFNPFLRRPFLQPVFGDRFVRRPFFSPRGVAPVPFRDRRTDFRSAVTTAGLRSGRARPAATAIRGRRVELRSETPVRPAGIDARRANWPVDVSPRSRELATEARRANWPVDMSPRLREPVPQARPSNWPVDVGPRRREPEMPTARRAGDDRGGVRPQIDGARMPEAHRVWRSEDRSGLEMVPDLGGRESFSSPSDRGSDRGGWSSPSGRGGDWGFARPAHPSHFGGRGISRR